MPIYEYLCDACGEDFERMQSFSEEPVRVCPRCGASSVRRVISPVGVIFKGSGWYITDSKRQISGTAAGGRKSASGEGKGRDGGSDAGSDAGPSSGGASGGEAGGTSGAGSGGSGGSSGPGGAGGSGGASGSSGPAPSGGSSGAGGSSGQGG